VPVPNTFFNYRDRSTKQGGRITDAAHNMFLWNQTLQGNDTAIDWKLISPTGVLLRQGTFDAAVVDPDWKIDWANAGQAGADVFFLLGGHEAISNGDRQNPVWGYVLPGILVPFNNNPTGGDANLAISYPAGVYLGNVPDPVPNPSPNPDPGPTPDAIADAVLTRFKADMVGTGEYGNLIQQRAKNGAVEAIARDVTPRLTAVQTAVNNLRINLPGFLTDQNAFLAVLRDGLYSWQRDRIYEVLNENRVFQAVAKILSNPAKGEDK